MARSTRRAVARQTRRSPPGQAPGLRGNRVRRVRGSGARPTRVYTLARMPVRHRAVVLTVLASTVLAPVAVAHAVKPPTIDVWSGKTHKKGDPITIYNVRGQKAVSVQLGVDCVTTEGEKQQVELSATGKLAGGKVKVTNKKADGQQGTLTVKATLPKTRAATGTITWSMPATAAYAACAGSDTIKLKHAITHGG
jgi:hypothetical protein